MVWWVMRRLFIDESLSGQVVRRMDVAGVGYHPAKAESRSFDDQCAVCSRLAAYLADIREHYPQYHARPVAPFGDPAARLLIVGLAPGFHGANATGRPFTGDHAGTLLYQTLYDFGFANRPHSTAACDGLELIDCRITNAVKCLPPQNKPTGEEINNCNSYLANELGLLPDGTVVLALGSIAHKAVLKALNLKIKEYPFKHAGEFAIFDGCLLSSYHCSRYNTQTGRLTPKMFQQVIARARKLLNG